MSYDYLIELRYDYVFTLWLFIKNLTYYLNYLRPLIDVVRTREEHSPAHHFSEYAADRPNVHWSKGESFALWQHCEPNPVSVSFTEYDPKMQKVFYRAISAASLSPRSERFKILNYEELVASPCVTAMYLHECSMTWFDWSEDIHDHFIFEEYCLSEDHGFT